MQLRQFLVPHTNPGWLPPPPQTAQHSTCQPACLPAACLPASPSAALPLTCRPLPLPCAAPSMMPGRSSSWILLSL